MNRPLPTASFTDGQSPPAAACPPAAQRWLDPSLGSAAAQPTGPVNAIRLRVRGAICRAPGAKWMDWHGQETFEADPLGFIWRARIRVAPFLWVAAEDRLDADGGYGGAHLLGVLPVGAARGPEVTRSQLVRCLAELAFVPTLAAHARGLAWSADTSGRVHPCGRGIDDAASVRVVVDEQGDIRVARSPDRPREDGRGGFLHEPYRLEFGGHERLPSGVRIPLHATGTFETAGGDWPYWRFEVIESD